MKKHFLRFTAAAFCLILFSSFLLAQDAPPKEENKREADLVELTKLNKTIKLDIRYATADNFVGKAVYTEARAFLQRPAAEALVRVHKKLKKQGLGLAIFDGYRPWAVTKLFWEVTSEDKRKFVANPATGSKHNRGCAVDLSMYYRKTGKLVEMPSGYDEFTERASPDYTGGTEQERANRDLLRKLMEAEGFTVNVNEWWHFDYKDWQDYAIYDIAFSSLRDLRELQGLFVRRVEFAGNEFTRDRLVRKHVWLKEGEVFAEKNLQKSVKGINSSGLFEKITDQAVSWFIDRENRAVDFVFYLIEKPKK